MRESEAGEDPGHLSTSRGGGGPWSTYCDVGGLETALRPGTRQRATLRLPSGRAAETMTRKGSVCVETSVGTTMVTMPWSWRTLPRLSMLLPTTRQTRTFPESPWPEFPTLLLPWGRLSATARDLMTGWDGNRQQSLDEDEAGAGGGEEAEVVVGRRELNVPCWL